MNYAAYLAYWRAQPRMTSERQRAAATLKFQVLTRQAAARAEVETLARQWRLKGVPADVARIIARAQLGRRA